jgi:uncharacterized membrane protein YebE (DUF533 family)
MTKLGIMTAAILAATSIGSISASADSIDRRQSMQEKRIQQGVRSGEITRQERARLEAEQARIRAMEHAAKSDGYVSPRERAVINQAQNEASRHIYHDKHDNDRRRVTHNDRNYRYSEGGWRRWSWRWWW